MYVCTWGHGNGLILHPVSKGSKMALMQHLRKNPPIRGIILQCTTTLPILFNDHCYLWLVLLLAFANCCVEVCLALLWWSWWRDLMSWRFHFLSLPSLLLSLARVPPLCLSPFPLWRAAGRPWNQGEQMLHEGGGGNAGVHADHHVLDVLVHALPLPFCAHTQPVGATWQLKKPSNVTRTGFDFFFFPFFPFIPSSLVL